MQGQQRVQQRRQVLVLLVRLDSSSLGSSSSSDKG
jgi:hypothetical protein